MLALEFNDINYMEQFNENKNLSEKILPRKLKRANKITCNPPQTSSPINCV